MIREQKSNALPEETVNEIVKLLKETHLTQTEIGEKLGVSQSIISAINKNNGRPRPNPVLRIRGMSGSWKLKPEDVEEIKRLLRETDLTQREIGRLFNVGKALISGINCGTRHANTN